MMISRFRRGQVGDIPALRALAEQCFAPYINAIGQMPAPGLETFNTPIAQGDVWVTGLPIDGYLIAYPSAPGFLIDAVAVSPNCQGRGIGRALIQCAETMASEQGHTLIWLYVNVRMQANIALYERLGYGIYDRKRQNGFDRVFMRKTL